MQSPHPIQIFLQDNLPIMSLNALEVIAQSRKHVSIYWKNSLFHITQADYQAYKENCQESGRYDSPAA